MTKQKSNRLGKYPPDRRTTFKEHSKHYAKVYSPYLPAVAGLVISAGLLFGSFKNTGSVLGYATATSPKTLLEQTNERRSENNDSALKISSELEYAAQSKADDMARRDYWSHVTPDGKQPWYFINQAGYKYSEAAENLAYGFTSSKDTVSGWMNSAEHRQALLNRDFTDVGFGVANAPDYQGKGPETIVVALYGKPQKPSLPVVNTAFTAKPSDTINRLEILGRGNWPWINLIAGIMLGIIATYLATKHSLKLRRRLQHGEEYILQHPAVDMSLLSVLILLLVLYGTVGFIR